MMTSSNVTPITPEKQLTSSQRTPITPEQCQLDLDSPLLDTIDRIPNTKKEISRERKASQFIEKVHPLLPLQLSCGGLRLSKGHLM